MCKLGVILCLFASVYAVAGKSRKDIPPAPLPSVVVNAKKVFLTNGGGSDLAYDTFYSERKNWGKYVIVGSPDDADLIVEISYHVEHGGTRVWSTNNTYNGTTQVHCWDSWKNVNFEWQTLEIRQALWEGELVAPKTEGSVRIIYFGPSLLSALTAQNQNSRHRGQDDCVFCKEDGSPLNPDVLRRDVLYPTLDRLGVARSSRSAGFHTFGHSAATIVNQKTGNLKLVQKLLGHSNLSTTADVYTHTSADADRSAALALEEAIFGDLFQVVPGLGTWNKNAAPN